MLNKSLARNALEAMQWKRRRLYADACDGLETWKSFQDYNQKFARFLDKYFDILHPG